MPLLDGSSGQMTGNKGVTDATKAGLEPEMFRFVVSILTPKSQGHQGSVGFNRLNECRGCPLSVGTNQRKLHFSTAYTDHITLTT